MRLSPEERRRQLIALGVEMLRDRAVEDISVGEIATQAGISRGLLFHYFSSKQDFQLAILRHANRELLHRTAPDPRRPAATTRSPPWRAPIPCPGPRNRPCSRPARDE